MLNTSFGIDYAVETILGTMKTMDLAGQLAR
jgi:hypothetical protein